MNKHHFYNRVIREYIQSDLLAIKTYIPHQQTATGGLNFPIALCILAYMEYLGSFFTGQTSERSFAENVRAYISKCFTHHADEYDIEILKDLFRDGLAHEYFARGGIIRDGGSNGPMFLGFGNNVILDAETLLNDFLESLDKFYESVTDEQVKQRTEVAEELRKQKLNKRATAISTLPLQSVPTSGTSTYPGPIP